MATTYLTPGVYVEEIDRGSKPIEGVGTAVAAFVGFAERGDIGKPTQITNWSQFTEKFGGFIEGSFLAHAVYGFFNNGGGVCYVNRLPGEVTNAHANGTAESSRPLPSPTTILIGRGTNQPTLEVTAVDPKVDDLTVEIRGADEGAPEDQFTIVIRGGGKEETHANVTFGRARGGRNIVETVNRDSKLVKVAERETAGALVERIPAASTYALARPAVASTEPAHNGHDVTALALPENLSPEVFRGNAAARTGVMGLEVAEDVTMVCVPDLMAAYVNGKLSDQGLRAVQTDILNHCENMQDRVAILDAPPGLNPQDMGDWRLNVSGYDSKYGALYYPWVEVANPLGDKTILVPPCGHVAGIWARNDSERGVHKAPANEVVRGALGLGYEITHGEQGRLNQNGVNCIRSFPGRGIRVWGARTISSDPAWRYLNVRRLFNYIEKSIDRGTQWVVFEPNDLYLWEKVKRDISAFLTRVWRDGALFGASPYDSFYVKCDEELNPVEVRDVGQMICEIGIAPVKPAEFVIFRITQYAGGAAEG
jgi:phage tail sheath protein FI